MKSDSLHPRGSRFRDGSIFAMIVLATVAIHSGCNRSTSTTPTVSSVPKASDSKGSLPHRSPAIAGSVDPSAIRFVSIPDGIVRLGSVKSEPGRDPLMERLKTVNVSGFDLSVSEITRAQWYPIMEPGRSVKTSEANWPITNITWYEATQFCELLTLKSGIVHRLPTESEWEYACRAGSEEMLSTWNGNCPLSDAITCYHRGDPGKLIRGIKVSCNVDSGKILPAGKFPPNRFGLHDMQGNCWEWVNIQDTLSEPPSPMHAPIRGGSAISTNPLECRAANRAWQPMSQAAAAVGLRIVRESER